MAVTVMLVTTFFGDFMITICICWWEKLIMMTCFVIVANFLIHNIGHRHLEVANTICLHKLSSTSMQAKTKVSRCNWTLDFRRCMKFKNNCQLLKILLSCLNGLPVNLKWTRFIQMLRKRAWLDIFKKLLSLRWLFI